MMPPARRGDLINTIRTWPRAILVFADGAFLHTPAVSHHELLTVLCSEATLIGAASMGALRASELHRFGMIGVGTVYDALIRNVFRDDSELATAMCPFSYQALTVPLVNIRRALALVRLNSESEDVRRAFKIAREVHFLHRTPELLARLWAAEVPNLCEHLTAALNDPVSDVKALDVIAAITTATQGGELTTSGSRLCTPRDLQELYEA